MQQDNLFLSSGDIFQQAGVEGVFLSILLVSHGLQCSRAFGLCSTLTSGSATQGGAALNTSWSHSVLSMPQLPLLFVVLLSYKRGHVCKPQGQFTLHCSTSTKSPMQKQFHISYPYPWFARFVQSSTDTLASLFLAWVAFHPWISALFRHESSLAFLGKVCIWSFTVLLH